MKKATAKGSGFVNRLGFQAQAVCVKQGVLKSFGAQ